MAKFDGFTSKQIDALAQYIEGADAFLQAFGQDYPDEAAKVDASAQELKDWAAS